MIAIEEFTLLMKMTVTIFFDSRNIILLNLKQLMVPHFRETENSGANLDFSFGIAANIPSYNLQ